MKAVAVLILIYVLSVSCAVYNVRNYGAVGDGKTKDTAAVLKAINLIAADGYGTILFPYPGVYYVAPFNLTSNIVLIVERGATILGSLDLADYPIIVPLPSYCQGREMDGPRYSTLIHSEHNNNITLTGEGTIDGSGGQWWNWTRSGTLQHTRGGLIEIMYANHVVINLRLINSPFWTIHPYSSNDVRIFRVTIDNPSNSPNTDGIDPDSSSNVHISDCWINSGYVSRHASPRPSDSSNLAFRLRSDFVDIGCRDDVIAIKSGIDYCGRQYNKPTINVTIENNIFNSGHVKGVSIGSEMSGGVKNVTMRNNFCNGTQVGPKIKTQRGRGGIVEDIHYSTFTIEKVGNAVVLDMFYSGTSIPPTNATATPIIRNISVEYLRGQATGAGYFNCLPEAPCTSVSLNYVTLDVTKGFTCSNVNGTSTNVTPTLCF